MRLIDADALEKDLRRQFDMVFKEAGRKVRPEDYFIERQAVYFADVTKAEHDSFFDYLKARPTIDAVPVVRCKDCEHWDISWEPENGNKGDHFCPMMALCVPPDFFCKHGERRCD